MPHSIEDKTLLHQFLHFDSINAEYIQDFNNVSQVSNSYNAKYSMTSVFKNVTRIYLTSLEMPVGFCNVRKGSTDTLSFVYNGSLYNFVLPEKNYSSIGSLLQDLNNAMLTYSSVFQLTFNAVGLRVSAVFNTAPTSFSFVDTNLSQYILGFRNKYDTLVGNTYLASYSNYNLNGDNYIHLYMPNIPSINASMSGNAKSTFKVPFQSVSNNVYFYQQESSFEQYVEVTKTNFTLSDLTVIIYDRYGNVINPRGYDFSFTLRLEYRG